MRDLNLIEQKIIDDLGGVWNQFMTLHCINESDDKEFMHKIHDLQRMIMSRPAIENEISKAIPKTKGFGR